MITEKTERLIDYLRSWLAARKWDVVDLARESGLSSPSLYDLMNGKTQNPKPETLQKIASVTGDAPEKLYELAGIAVTGTTPRSEKIRRILALLDDLDERHQDMLILTAQTLREDQRRNETASQEDRVRRKPAPAK